MYQFRFRTHDPQIGRFIQIDPLADKYEYNSTYAYAENKVINGIDLEGLEWFGLPLLGSNPTIMRGPVIEQVIKPSLEGGLKVSEVGAKTPGSGGKPKFTLEQLQRFKQGREVEAEQLVKTGLEKNISRLRLLIPKQVKRELLSQMHLKMREHLPSKLRM